MWYKIYNLTKNLETDGQEPAGLSLILKGTLCMALHYAFIITPDFSIVAENTCDYKLPL